MLDQLDIFHGEATPHRALIYARLPVPETPGRWSLDGIVRGPMAEGIRTLPASATLVDCGAGPTLLAKAVVTDPCGWSPDSPVWYDVEVTLRVDGQAQQRHRGRVAIRRLGTANRHLVWEQRRWWLYAIDTGATGQTDPAAWRDAGAAILATNPGSELCDAAARQGIPLIVPVAGDTAAVVAQLRQLARQPAVAMAIVRHAPRGDLDLNLNLNHCPLRAAAPNLFLVEPVAVDGIARPASWAQAVVVPWSDLPSWKDAAAGSPLPILVSRPCSSKQAVAELRAACDAWRDEWVSLELAGFIV